jgi:hypothetical protein
VDSTQDFRSYSLVSEIIFCSRERDAAGIRQRGFSLARKPVLRVVDHLATVNPEWVHPMHGGSSASDLLPGHVHAFMNEPFIFDGRIFERMLAC